MPAEQREEPLIGSAAHVARGGQSGHLVARGVEPAAEPPGVLSRGFRTGLRSGQRLEHAAVLLGQSRCAGLQPRQGYVRIGTRRPGIKAGSRGLAGRRRITGGRDEERACDYCRNRH